MASRASLQALAEAAALLRSEQVAKGAAGTTLSSALEEEAVRLDSSQGSSTRGRMGKLQRVQSLRVRLFGEDGTGGLFAKLREEP